jgi:hypothetical protein
MVVQGGIQVPQLFRCSRWVCGEKDSRPIKVESRLAGSPWLEVGETPFHVIGLNHSWAVEGTDVAIPSPNFCQTLQDATNDFGRGFQRETQPRNGSP